MIFCIFASFAFTANALDLFKKAQKTGVHVFDDYEKAPVKKAKEKESPKAAPAGELPPEGAPKQNEQDSVQNQQSPEEKK